MIDAPALRRPGSRDVTTFVVWLLAFASVVSWRQGVLYSGGTDPVVVAKAAVSAGGVIGAVLVWRTAPARRPLSPFPVLLVGAIVGISLVGAIQAGTLAANVVLAVRIGLLALTVVLLLASTPTRTAITGMLTAMAAIGVFAATSSVALSFLGHGSGRSRLTGGIPPLEPNELATLVLPAAIGLTYVVIRRGIRPWPTVGLLLLAGIILASGSRTALAMLGIGAAVIALRERRFTRGVAAAGLVAILGAYVVVAFSSTVTQLTLRGQGTGQLLTLNSRTISWNAVLQTPADEWQWWIGNGLSMKSIAVLGQYWSTQVFDSSWISSIAQDGWIGTAILAVYAAGTIIATARRRSLDSLAMALVVTVFLRSFVENGLIDSSASFTVFFAIALAAWPGARPLHAPVPSAQPAERVGPRELPVPAWAMEPPAPSR